MKPEHDALHSLIRSLSADERAGFKKTLATYTLKGRKNFFITLFESLLKMDAYSYDVLTTVTKGIISPASLSSLKSQLKKKLMSYLRENDTHYYKRWHALLEDAHILVQRGIFDEARLMLKKVVEEASEANRKYYVVAALRIEGLIVQHLNEQDIVSATVALGNHIVATSNDILRTSRIYDFYTTIAAITFKGNMSVRNAAILSQLKTLSTSEIYNLATDNLHVDEQLLLLVAKYNLARHLCRLEEFHALAQKRLNLVKSNLHYFQKYQGNYIPAAYVDYIETCTLVQNQPARDEALREFKIYVKANFPNVQFYEDYAFYLQHTYAVHNETAYAKLDKTMSELESFYHAHPHLPVLMKKLFEMSLLWSAYKMGSYDKALDYGRKLTQENISEETADDIQDLIRIVVLAIRFEQLLANGFKKKEFPAFVSFVTSEYHYFRKKKDFDYRLELAIISVFRNIPKIEKKQLLVPHFEKLKGTIQGWLDNDVAHVQTFNLGFKIIHWIDTQIARLDK